MLKSGRYLSHLFSSSPHTHRQTTYKSTDNPHSALSASAFLIPVSWDSASHSVLGVRKAPSLLPTPKIALGGSSPLLELPLPCSALPRTSHSSFFNVGEKLPSLNDPWCVPARSSLSSCQADGKHRHCGQLSRYRPRHWRLPGRIGSNLPWRSST
jgi:hypothetical protein